MLTDCTKTAWDGDIQFRKKIVTKKLWKTIFENLFFEASQQVTYKHFVYGKKGSLTRQTEELYLFCRFVCLIGRPTYILIVTYLCEGDTDGPFGTAKHGMGPRDGVRGRVTKRTSLRSRACTKGRMNMTGSADVVTLAYYRGSRLL